MLPLHTKPTPMPSGVSIGLTAGKGEASANSGCPRCCFHPPWANPATPAVPEQEDTCGLLPKEGPAARAAGGHTRSAPGSAGPRVRHGDSAPLPCASETLQTRAGPSGCHFPRPALDHKPLRQENRKRAGLLLPRGHARSRAAARCGRSVPNPSRCRVGAGVEVSLGPPRGRQRRRTRPCDRTPSDFLGEVPVSPWVGMETSRERFLEDCTASEPRAVNELKGSHLWLFPSEHGPPPRWLLEVPRQPAPHTDPLLPDALARRVV